MAILIGSSQIEICNLALRRMGATTISAIDEGTKNADYCSAFWDYILGEVLEDYAWNFGKKTSVLDYTSGFKVYSDSDEKTITGITQANPAVASCASHGFSTTQTVYITDVSGMTEVNDRVYEIEDVDGDSYKLVDMDSTSWTAYTSGGVCYRKEVDPKYSLGYTYDLPSDYLRALYLSDKKSEFEVIGAGDNMRLCTTVSDAILTYIAFASDTANMVARFISAMAWRLAAELCIPLSKKGIKQKEAMAMYDYVLGKGTKVDSINSRPKIDDSDPWLDSGGFNI